MGSIKTDANGHGSQLLHIDATFNNKNLEESAIELVYRIQPKWRAAPGKLEVVKFTDGITNTVRPPLGTYPSLGTCSYRLSSPSCSKSANIYLAYPRMRSIETPFYCVPMATTPKS